VEVKVDETTSVAISKDEVEEDEEDYDDALLFLPTGLSRPRPKTFWKGSDPEWEEFKKLSGDRPRIEKIRSMCSRILDACQKLTLKQTN
jgi:hypothetical protein